MLTAIIRLDETRISEATV